MFGSRPPATATTGTPTRLAAAAGDELPASLWDRFLEAETAARNRLGRETPPVVRVDRPLSRKSQLRRVADVGRQIRRDLNTLLSTRRARTDADLAAWPAIRDSVLHYGLPDLAGATASGIDVAAVERTVLQVIGRFEPRLHRDTLEVRGRVIRGAASTLLLDIRGGYGPRDRPSPLSLQVEICLQGGGCRPLD